MSKTTAEAEVLVRILLLDIETAPHRVYAWGLFDQRIPIDRIVEPGYTLCWSAKWLGESGLIFDSVQHSKPRPMLLKIHRLLNEADAVVHYNGKRFDIPTLQGEFARHGMLPPAPFRHVDLLHTCRQQFRFASNKLDYVAKHLGLGQKTSHKGMPLWHGCMTGDEACWRMMEKYNKQDVRLLERLYNEIRPWIKNHPNLSSYERDEVCPTCGGNHYQARGKSVSVAAVYQRYQCLDCGKWFKAAKADVGSRSPFREAA